MTRHTLRRLAAACTLAALAVVSVSATAETLRKFSLPELAGVLAAEGYGSVEVDDHHVRFMAEGRTFGLYRYADGDLQMFYGITGVELLASDVNDWNRTYRLSRAYLDENGDPVLEADLLANAGLSPRIVTEFVRVFVDASAQYRNFVLEHDRSGETPPASRRPIGSL